MRLRASWASTSSGSKGMQEFVLAEGGREGKVGMNGWEKFSAPWYEDERDEDPSLCSGAGPFEAQDELKPGPYK